jgi:protein-disulfide isomerase
MNRNLVFAAAAVVLALGGGWFLSQGSNSSPMVDLVGAANAQTTEEVDTSGIVEMVQGNPDASVVVVEYASFTCPHCANFHGTGYKELKRDYIDTGKIKFVYREIYFDKYGLWASAVARCGGEEKFFGITEMIYATQKTWSRQDSEGAIAGELRKIGRTAGIGEEQLEACLQDGDNFRALVAWFQKNATDDDVSSTPTFLVNGVQKSGNDIAGLRALIDQKLGN